MFSMFREQKHWPALLLIFFFAYLIFIIGIEFPHTHNFDEFHYVPSAKQVLEFKKNQNWEHPPLGKELMAIGIGIFGDNPLGWRVMSVLFGAFTLSGMYALALVLFDSPIIALWSTLLTFSNQLLYVQARIGMLDTFMMGFLVWALAAFFWCWKPGRDPVQVKRTLIFSGVMFSLATATKWFAVVPWFACFLLYVGVRLFRYWGVQFGPEKLTTGKNASTREWYHPEIFPGVSFLFMAISYFGIGILIYFSTFIPIMAAQDSGFGIADLLARQGEMFGGQLRVVNNHPYMSQWTGWPVMARPIWYAYDADATMKDHVRGVLLLGNPLLMWGGLAALLFCVWDWIKTRHRLSFLITFAYGTLYFCWALIPRKIAFYYYYYPAGMILSFAWARFWFRKEEARDDLKNFFSRKYLPQLVFLGISLAVFVYFLPILSAQLIPNRTLGRWTWFRAWI